MPDARHHTPIKEEYIVITDDENENENETRNKERNAKFRSMSRSPERTRSVSIISDGSNYISEDEFRGIVQEDQDEKYHPGARTPTPQAANRRKTNLAPLRNGPLQLPYIDLGTYEHNGDYLRPRCNVELEDGNFMRIVHIIQDLTTESIFLRGWVFRRTYTMNGMLEKKINELCWVMHVEEDDDREPEQQGMEDVSVTSVVRRRLIKLTNQTFPALSWRESKQKDYHEVILRERVLVCRFKHICWYANAKARKLNKFGERVLCRLRCEESDRGCGIDDSVLREAWRGSTEKGGSSSQALSSVRTELLKDNLPAWQQLSPRPKPKNLSPRAQTGDNSGFKPCIPMPGSCADSPYEIDVAPPRSNTGSFQPLSTQLNQAPVVDGLENLKIQEGESSETRRSLRLHDRPHSSLIDLTDDNDLRKGLGSLSIQRNTASGASRKRRARSPEVIEIDMGVKSTSSTGVVSHRWQGRVTTSQPSIDVGIWLNTNGFRESATDIAMPPTKRARAMETLEHPSESRRLSVNPRSLSQANNETTIVRKQSPSILATDSSFNPLHIQEPNERPQRLSSRVRDNPWIGTSLTLKGRNHNLQNIREDSRRYTFGDAFCGAGGTSRGAVMAGLLPQWGFDWDGAACKTYNLNFPSAEIFELEAYDFAGLKDKDHKVDILHMSPPCQFFSDAHTTEGKNDEVNTASQFVISDLLKKTKPRLATMEQTSGLPRRYPHYLHAILQMFTAVGFSIRWTILNCSDYGVPQRRKRMFVIASWYVQHIPHHTASLPLLKADMIYTVLVNFYHLSPDPPTPKTPKRLG